jgi:hypothetical protein
LIACLQETEMTRPVDRSSSAAEVGPYGDFAEIVKRYWKSYGGLKELGRSPFLHAAVVLAALAAPSWSSSAWSTVAVSVLPNLLGFGVSGYAIWIGWGDPEFRRRLAQLEMGPGVSAYAQVSATFAHFALMQVLALLWALMFSFLDYVVAPGSAIGTTLQFFGLRLDAFASLRPAGAAIGFFLFVYAILVAFEATLALFRLATWLQREPPAQ